MTPPRFPHSDIRGSRPACGSPRLFAVPRVLLRPSAPRHPPRALLRSAPRSREGKPPLAFRVETLEKKNLDKTTLCVPTVEPRVTHAHVVAHEQIAGAEELGELGELPMLHVPARAIQYEERSRPPRSRLLRNAMGRQKVVEEIDAHRLPRPVILSGAKDLLWPLSPADSSSLRSSE